MLGPVHVTFSLAGALFALSLFEAAAANDAIPSTVSHQEAQMRTNVPPRTVRPAAGKRVAAAIPVRRPRMQPVSRISSKPEPHWFFWPYQSLNAYWPMLMLGVGF